VERRGQGARAARGLAGLLLLAVAVACSPSAARPPGAVPAVEPTAGRGSGAASGAAPDSTGAPGTAGATASPAPTKIAVAYASKGANQLPLWLSVERGYFAQEGLDAELVFLSSTLSTQGLIADSVQFMLAGNEGVELNLEAGSPLTTIIAGVTPKLAFKAFAQPAIRTVEDLRGKTIAATRQGSVSDFAWRKLLEPNGLQLGQDVAAVYPGTSEAVLTAVIADHAQAGMGSTPTDLVAQKQGLRILADLAQMDIPFLMGAVTTRTDLARATPDLVERYLRAHLQGVHSMLTDAETSLAVLGKYSEQDDREFVRAGYEFFRPTMTRDQLVPEASLVAVLQESTRPNARTANPKDFYDNGYLERIEAGGYLDRLYGGR
jgi:NitT/TauT family transport system substrate-binding protein